MNASEQRYILVVLMPVTESPCTCSNPVICLRSEERKRKRVGEKGKGEKEEKDIRADKSRPCATFPFFFPFALSTAHLSRRSTMTMRFHDVPLLRRRAPRRDVLLRSLYIYKHRFQRARIKNLFDR